eukprot:TRINITY_DN11053_c0_g1_i5.p1 TRINITY_DN11053_c0_g1~~TRINITY_DN11053_c0_g1_i5.p1  ORF type:complete len:272 (-),score=61.04 TRINITY_DN11053_c0_g1_i5:61-876(-)
MCIRDRNRRCTAAQALKHQWFSLESTNLSSLSNAQDNMKKYQNDTRFDVGRIKPVLSIITCTPLLCTRALSKASPLIIPDYLQRSTGMRKVPAILQKIAGKEEKKSRASAKDANKALRDRRPAPLTNKDDSGNYDEGVMDEKPFKAFDNPKANIHGLPKTPGFSFKNSSNHLKLNTTPHPDHRDVNGTNRKKAINYLKEVAGVKMREDAKSRERKKMYSTVINPFNDSVCRLEELETYPNKDSVNSTKDGNTPRLPARKLRTGKSFAPKCK